ncbi:hypothetical protein KVF89_07240 [Nocardioides carbamazepini]|uniref:hypothetical protein n=1 Tax=Nocardioides carbamazepini TaxID=2854259 RepID=UPI00214A0638|nr:hypothetical protein [Nocardioides carbamazepini]MCR1782322.1 hypothetical protein [Nocardioides carbamazepini]
MVDIDLIYDPNEVGADLVVLTWISQGPRSGDATFDPQPADLVRVTDVDGEDLRARVVGRDGNRVWVRLDVPGLIAHPA